MLEGGRFDYFPRAVHEPCSEVVSRKELGLTIEEELMLIYPLPLYLFVSKDNKALALEITRLFEDAIADGSFDTFFFNYPLIKDVMNKTHIDKRKVFKIDNPHLTVATPLDRKELWLDLTSVN
ncbi:hypothetical protein [Catenovulum adriaticum]|uniref:Extracellular solute-binding protein (Family 3) n=1 Tax=Catenovulum adriaticum TaxID=2984846 RepID=A0ABY7ATS2_9ALTE|nr:hypothetical protein [Catenovulum sp. TS8]WAJ71764.1 hypothetical protein OLW01_15610 [Catenovulum sp. TS8]